MTNSIGLSNEAIAITWNKNIKHSVQVPFRFSLNDTVSKLKWPSGFASLATIKRNEFVVCVQQQVCYQMTIYVTLQNCCVFVLVHVLLQTKLNSIPFHFFLVGSLSRSSQLYFVWLKVCHSIIKWLWMLNFTWNAVDIFVTKHSNDIYDFRYHFVHEVEFYLKFRPLSFLMHFCNRLQCNLFAIWISAISIIIMSLKSIVDLKK